MYNLEQNKKKKKVYPCKPQFYYINLGLRGYTLHGHVFAMMVIFCTIALSHS